MSKFRKILLLLLLGCMITFVVYCMVADKIAGGNDPDNHCECIDYDCGCCSRLHIKPILDGKLCGNFSYLPDQYGFSATVTYNTFTIYNETMSVKNPPPICILHNDSIAMAICFNFRDLDVNDKCFSGCMELEIILFEKVAAKKIQLLCFGQGCKKTPLLTRMKNNFFYLIGQSKK